MHLEYIHNSVQDNICALDECSASYLGCNEIIPSNANTPFLSGEVSEELSDKVYGKSVCARLKYFISFWHDIGASSWVLRAIENSYYLPFVNIPPPKVLFNSSVSLVHTDFINSAIHEVLECGAVSDVQASNLVVAALCMSWTMVVS